MDTQPSMGRREPPGRSCTASATPSSRSAAALTSQTRAPATSPAGAPDRIQNRKWRQAHEHA
jgi:hypothetical protein